MRGSARTRYVIAYDVESDANRTRLAGLLLDYGDRVQKSVYEADLSREDVKEILKKAANYIDVGDSLRMYPLCGGCLGGVRMLGRTSPDLRLDLHIV